MGPEALIRTNDIEQRWFDYWLKGIDTGIRSERPVQIFVMGDNVWREEDEVAARAHQIHSFLPS